MKLIQVPLLFFLQLFALNSSNGSQILLLAPFPGPSHWLMMKHIIRELVDRGHEVTAITAIKFNKPLKNYTEYYIDPPYPLNEKFNSKEIFKMKFNSDFNNLFLYWENGKETSEFALKNQVVQNFIARQDLHFDLVISEQYFQESWLMFAHKFQAPIVTVGTYGYSDFYDRAMGFLTPLSFVPHMLLVHYGDDMTFSQRCYNLLLSMFDALYRKYNYMPENEKIAKKYFKALEINGPLPTVEELEKSISVMLINSHFSINKPRPLMPGLINIAGAHVKPPKSLPADIQNFLDGALDGAIYFSIGAYMKSSHMPQKTVEIILKVFKSLKQKVLWKWEDDKIPNLPSNVMVKKWMPQSDILAHKNIKLFISHGGMFGLIEGTHRGVPILFLPLYGDQHRNAMNAESQGYAMKLNFSEITEESLQHKIQEILQNEKFSRNAKQISHLLKDNPIEPMTEAMFWIEYVIRNKGAKHLKSAAVNLPWYQYMMLDIIGMFVGILVFILIIVRKLMKVYIKNMNGNLVSEKVKNQ